jgi:hypothetical protein
MALVPYVGRRGAQGAVVAVGRHVAPMVIKGGAKVAGRVVKAAYDLGKRAVKRYRNRSSTAMVVYKQPSAPRHRAQTSGTWQASNNLPASGTGSTKMYKMNIPLRRECLGAVTTPGATFTNVTYVLNPANNTTFPWLSTIATKFEKYKFSHLKFIFVSTSASSIGSTNTALGSVLLNTNYDILDPSFTSQQQMEDYGGLTEVRPSRNGQHTVDTVGRIGGNRGERYVLSSTGATATYPSSSSAHDYDLGSFQIATVGMQAASTVGRLYVEYALTLIRPKLDTPLGQGLIAAHYAGAPTTTSIFAGMTSRSGSTMALTFPSNTSFVIPSPGRYLVCIDAKAATTFTAGGGLTASTNCTAVVVLNGNTASTAGASQTTETTIFGIFDVNAVNGVITVAAPTTVTGAATSDLIVSQIPGALLEDVREPTNMADRRIRNLENIMQALMAERTRLGNDCKSDAYNDCHENSEDDDFDMHVEPEHGVAVQHQRIPPPLKGDYVIRSDGSVVPMSGSTPGAKAKASLSSSVLNSLGIGS